MRRTRHEHEQLMRPDEAREQDAREDAADLRQAQEDRALVAEIRRIAGEPRHHSFKRCHADRFRRGFQR